MSAPGPSRIAVLPLVLVALALIDPAPSTVAPIRTRTPRSRADKKTGRKTRGTRKVHVRVEKGARKVHVRVEKGARKVKRRVGRPARQPE